ncbi:MAG: pyruvate kinase alpha/beta domain-containing protein [Promethearchaeota archaeon]
MTDLNIEVTYFEKGGPDKTDETLSIAKKYSDQFGIKDIILASTTGTTAEKALDIFDVKKYNIIVITHAYYFIGSQKRQEFPEDKMEELKKKGLKIHSSTHAMSGIERGMRIKKEAWQFVDLLAKIISWHFSQGVKVCIEIASMAADAGLIDSLERDIICIGGTGRGADTTCLIKPAPTSDFKNLRVKAILAKPL